MKLIATIGLSLLVLLAALALLLCSTCALGGGPFGDDRVTFSVLAMISLAAMIGGIILIAKINRKEQPAIRVTPPESVTTSKSQVDENK